MIIITTIIIRLFQQQLLKTEVPKCSDRAGGGNCYKLRIKKQKYEI